MSSVFQQIITDSLICTPGGDGNTKVERKDANRGLAVKLSAVQTNRNVNGFAAVTVEKTGLWSDKIFGILGDFHDDNTVTILRKGKIFISTNHATPADSWVAARASIDQVIFILPGLSNLTGAPASDFGKCRPSVSNVLDENIIGEILEVGNHPHPSGNPIGNYMIVDLNLPVR